MQARDPRAVLRAAYALERDEASWVRGIVAAARAYDFGLGVVGCVLEVHVDGARRRSLVVDSTDTLDESMFADVVDAPTSAASRSRVARSVHARRPARYVWGVAGGSPPEWIVLFFPCKSHDDGWSSRDLDALDEIGAHLGAALRLRRAARLPVDDDQALPRPRRAQGDEKRALWTQLLEGKWSVIENVEADGRRTLVCCGREGEDSERRLAAVDASVVHHVVLGHSFKVAAYELGLSISGVAGCLRRALRVLGLSSRAELIRCFRPWVVGTGRALPTGEGPR